MRRQAPLRLLPAPIRAFPADLAVTILVAVATVLIAARPGTEELSVRVVLGFLFVLFLPGYAFVSALYPEAGTAVDEYHGTGTPRDARGIDGVERTALSFAMSIALVPLVAFALEYTPWGLRFGTLLVTLCAFTVVCSSVAAERRRSLPDEMRFSVPYRRWASTAYAGTFESDRRASAALNVALVLSVVLATATLAYGVAVPPEGERFTQFSLLTEDDDGERVAAGYPDAIVQGEPEPLIVGIANHERETIEYTVVAQLQRVEHRDGETEVAEHEELDRFTRTVEHDETRYYERSASPTMTGEDLRLTYLLYTDDVPERPTAENAYRSLHVWLDVEPPGTAAEGDERTEDAN